MKTLYAKFTEPTFRKLTIVLMFSADLIASFLTYLRFSNKEAFIRGWQEATANGGLELTSGDPVTFATQVHSLFLQAVLMGILFHILFHIIIYLTYYYEKKLPYLYLKIATWFFAFISMVMGLSGVINQEYIGLGFIALSFVYLFVALGLRLFPVSSLKKLAQ